MINERVRKWVATACNWGGWLTSLGSGIYAVVGFNPAAGQIAPAWVSFTFIFAVGVGIAGGSAASRIRMAETIVEAFKSGYQVNDLHRRSKEGGK